MTTSLPGKVVLILWVSGVLLPLMPVQGIDLPRPDRIVREVRGVIKRAARELTDDERSAPSRAKKSQPPPSKPGSPAPPTDVRPDSPMHKDPAAVPGEDVLVPAAPAVQQTNSPPELNPPASRMERSGQPKPRVTQEPEPVSQGTVPQEASRDPLSTEPPPEPGLAVSERGPKSPAPVVSNESAKYALPVPGKPGLVYPPGAEQSSGNMVDVSGMKQGQLARDPRTKKLFRVP